MRSEFVIAGNIKTTVLWGVTSCCLVEIFVSFIAF